MEKGAHSFPLLLVRRVRSQLCQLPFPEWWAISLIRKQSRKASSSPFTCFHAIWCSGAPAKIFVYIRATHQASLAAPYLLKFHSWDPSDTCKPAMFSARSYSCLKSASVILAED